jgi:hypothetical protein
MRSATMPVKPKAWQDKVSRPYKVTGRRASHLRWRHLPTTVGTAVAAPTSPEAAATPDGGAVHTPYEDLHATTSTGGPTGGDTAERAHAAELEATLLAVSSPEREAPPDPAGAGQTDPPPAAAEAEV